MSLEQTNLGPSGYGPWTPTITGDGGSSGQVYGIQIGRYVREGRVIKCWFDVQLSTLGTITGNVCIGGFPFNFSALTNLRQSGVIGFWANMTTAIFSAFIDSAGTTIAIIRAIQNTAGSTTIPTLVQADLAATTRFNGYIEYLTDDL